VDSLEPGFFLSHFDLSIFDF